MNVRSNTGYAIMLAYLLGNALTYNHLIKAGRSAIGVPGDASFLIVKSLLVSMVWPLYSLYYAVAG
jgi:hypothetical protein